MIAPEGSLVFHEKAWNAYPYCRTSKLVPQVLHPAALMMRRGTLSTQSNRFRPNKAFSGFSDSHCLGDSQGAPDFSSPDLCVPLGSLPDDSHMEVSLTAGFGVNKYIQTS